jgi:anti-anti-sigma regulatory factor
MHDRTRFTPLADFLVILPEEFQQKLDSLESAARIILDLHGVETIDPHVLKHLAKIRQRRRKRGLASGRMVVDSPHLRSALSAVGFDRHWPIFKSIEEAAASFEHPRRYA